jgi:hypothetical protein
VYKRIYKALSDALGRKASLYLQDPKHAGAFNEGWYGGDRISQVGRLHPRGVSKNEQWKINERHLVDTKKICQRYLSGVVSEPDVFQRVVPPTLIRHRMESAEPRLDVPESGARSTYSIITSFFEHEEYFRRCALSVAALVRADWQSTEINRIEWVITNDDPKYSRYQLLSMVPATLRPFVRVLSDGTNRGIATRLNEAIPQAACEWMLFLDCDDLIEANATLVLDQYTRRFSHCRYISSAMIDIDEQDRVLRFRRHVVPPSTLFHNGMVAGHLKAIRCDLIAELFPLVPEFSGCQDYDFALRVALREPLLLIPEYLYRYRWHDASQSVGSAVRQDQIATAVRQEFLRTFVAEHLLTAPPAAPVQPAVPSGLCIIRTKGENLHLLNDAIRSVLEQNASMTPCIVLDCDMARVTALEAHVRAIAPAAVILRTSSLGRGKGQFNVALDYLDRERDSFGFFCCIEEHHVLYPFYAARLAEAHELTGADISFALSTERGPGDARKPRRSALPTAALVAANFVPLECCLIRTDLLVRSRARFGDYMGGLEEWDFLLALLTAGAQVWHLPETLCESRKVHRVEDPEKGPAIDFRERVLARRRDVAKTLGTAQFVRDVAEFDFSDRPPLSPEEIAQLIEARHVFENAEALRG